MKRSLSTILFIFLPFLLACQSNNAITTSTVDVNTLYLDKAFIEPASFTIESEQEIFMLNDEMLALVQKNLVNNTNTQKKAAKLLKLIFSQENISLSYASHANLTARETFYSHKANCLSLTIMAYALANAAGMQVDFQQVEVPEYWVRNGQYSVLTGHVNLMITGKKVPNNTVIYGTNNYEVDFDPYITKQRFPKKVIGKNTVLAMFYNNKGGQALVDNDFDSAYQYFKAATNEDKYFSPAWGNLAILYRITNNLDLAERTYRYAAEIDSNNLTALSNLAMLLRNQNNIEEADILDEKLLAKRKANPYYYAVLADEAYYRKDYLRALQYYKKAIKLNNNIHEIYFGIARVYYQMNRLSEAKKSLKRALALNKSESTEHQYIAKLNFLNAEITN